MAVYFTIEQIKSANKAAGHHWFEPDTMRFFRSRVSGPVIGNMFVSSENDRLGGGRLYTIRRANDDGSIDTVGEFQAYGTKAQALAAIRQMTRDTGDEISVHDLRVRDGILPE